MQEYSLPEDIRGEWIWSGSAHGAVQSYVFFRKEFALSETPASAELWLSARTLFHLFFNGRYIGFGPTPSPNENSYVVYYDLGFLAETGNNTIAVLAHNTQVTRYAEHRHESGLWCQLNIEGKPVVCSDRTWMLWHADCFAPRRHRSSSSTGFTEKLDFRYYPHGWNDKDFNSVRWAKPDHMISLGKARGRLVPLPAPETNLTRQEPVAIVERGTFEPLNAITQVSFAHLAEERGAGVYLAECYFFHRGSDTLEFELYTDDPYRLFLNQELVKQQGLNDISSLADLERARPTCFAQAEQVEPEGVLHVRQGWNQLILIQQVQPESAGATVIFPDFGPDELLLLRKEAQENMIGWSISGPIRTPLALATGNLSLRHLPKSAYVPTIKDYLDDSAFLMSCHFEAFGNAVEAPGALTLEEGDYVILDMGLSVYGCPELRLSGNDGDVVDVVCSEHLIEGQLVPILDGRRLTSTLVLGAKKYHWIGVAPRGFRYMMLVARKTSDTVTVESARACIREFVHDNPGLFECDSKVLNSVWAAGERTLRATMQGVFMDAPTKENAQYIADAMIQSWAAYHVFGAFDAAAKAIEEFAQVQFETGEMPALAPSDIYLNMPDYALLWPVWLQRHYLYTGNSGFLKKMLPALENLFSYYQQISLADYDVLGELDSTYGAYCFLDHGYIDRTGIVTGLNALYCRALLSGAWLLEQAEVPSKAAEYRQRAAHIARMVRELTWDSERGLFADSWHEGEMSEFYSWQTNVLALYGGIPESTQYDAIFAKLFSDKEPFALFAAGDANNPYFQYFVLESAFALGKRQWAFKLLRHYWGGMLQQGAKTWWELFDPEAENKRAPLVSLCHGYGTSPNGFLITELVGIRPAKPGFTTVYFNPLPEVCPRVKAHIPTPYGRINIEWQHPDDGDFEVAINANYPLDVVPILNPKYAGTAVIHVNDEVNILAEIDSESAD